MIAALIFVVSFAVLLQFFISYSRSLIAAHRKSELSEQVLEVAGIEKTPVAGDEFPRLVQLVRLCPEGAEDRKDIQVVGAYHKMLGVLRAVSRSISPRLAAWVEVERQNCSYFAAVALDRRIAYNRDLLTQQLTDHI